jgi:hypothetical protein
MIKGNVMDLYEVCLTNGHCITLSAYSEEQAAGLARHALRRETYLGFSIATVRNRDCGF